MRLEAPVGIMGRTLDCPAKAGAARPGRIRHSREERKARLLGSLRIGIPRPSPSVLELNRLLGSSPVDLGKVAALVESDPALSRAVWTWCAQASGTPAWPGESLDEAIVLLGIDRFRFIAATESFRSSLPHSLDSKMLTWFWRHSHTVACLSDRIGRWSGYSPAEHPFLAGLYHDVGMLPLIEVALRPGNGVGHLRKSLGDVQREKRRFGTDHCTLGGMMALAWDFPPAFIDAFTHHHEPEQSDAAPHLTRIVAAADELARRREVALPTFLRPIPPGEILLSILPNLGGAQAHALAGVLGDELIHLHGYGDLAPAALLGVGEAAV